MERDFVDFCFLSLVIIGTLIESTKEENTANVKTILFVLIGWSYPSSGLIFIYFDFSKSKILWTNDEHTKKSEIES